MSHDRPSPGLVVYSKRGNVAVDATIAALGR